MKPHGTHLWLWPLLMAVVAFLYAPLIPPFIRALGAEGATGEGAFALLFGDRTLGRAMGHSGLVALAVGVSAPLLGLALAQALRAWNIPKTVLRWRCCRCSSPESPWGSPRRCVFSCWG
ncbi:MAG: hypothetical protein ACFCBW_17780 [Candidatus Competibacterales bacterium]